MNSLGALLCFKLLRSVKVIQGQANYSKPQPNATNYSSKRKLNLVQNTFQNHRKYFSKTLKLFIEIHRKIKFKPLPRSTANSHETHRPKQLEAKQPSKQLIED